MCPVCSVNYVTGLYLSKGSPLKGEGDQGKGLLWEKKGPGSLIRALSAVIDEMKKDYFSSSSS
jgi:hypothetical protein